jgi:hypothetical protein
MTADQQITLQDLKGNPARRRRERIIRSAFLHSA